MSTIIRRLTSIAKAGIVFAALLSPFAMAAAETTIKFVPHADLKILDPIWNTAFITRNHAYLVYDTLFATDEQGTIKPQMVDTWNVSADGLTWSFKLRDGLKFHDGAAVRPIDCTLSIERWMKRDVAGQQMQGFVKELAVVDDKSFEIRLRRPFGYMLDVLGKMSSNVPFIMREADAKTDAFQQVTEVVGSGPFVFRKDLWVQGSRAVYDRFPGYVPRAEKASWAAGGKVAKVDRIEWVYIPDGNTALAALNRGEIDWIEQPLTDLLPLVARNRDVIVEALDPQGSMATLRPNFLHPPFNNPLARQALLMMVDQADYMRAVLGDEKYWMRCPSFYGCKVPYTGKAPDKVLVQRNYDIARDLLKRSGYDGRPIVVLNSVDVPWTAAMAQVTAQNLRAIGANVEVRNMDLSSLLTARSKKDAPDQGGWNIVHSWNNINANQSPLTNNTIRMNGDKASPGWPSDDKVEALMAEWMLKQTDAEKLAGALAIQDRLFEAIPVVPLGQFVAPSAYRRNLDGIIRAPIPFFWGVAKK